jgi:hypothetical protein
MTKQACPICGSEVDALKFEAQLQKAVDKIRYVDDSKILVSREGLFAVIAELEANRDPWTKWPEAKAALRLRRLMEPESSRQEPIPPDSILNLEGRELMERMFRDHFAGLGAVALDETEIECVDREMMEDVPEALGLPHKVVLRAYQELSPHLRRGLIRRWGEGDHA